jgi:hypothetical protein
MKITFHRKGRGGRGRKERRLGRQFLYYLEESKFKFGYKDSGLLGCGAASLVRGSQHTDSTTIL